MKTELPKAVTDKQRAAIQKLLERLRLQYSERIRSTILFGSVARGDFRSDSDIDMLVIADKIDSDFKWKVWEIGADVSLEFDVIFNLRVYPRVRWEHLGVQRKPLWRNISREGITLDLHSPIITKRGSKKKFLRAMKKVANVEPEARDRL